MPRPPPKLKPEAQEQADLVEWLELHNYKFTAIPNSTYTKSFYQKWLNTKTGLRAGLPDMLIILKRGSLFFCEMKLPRKKLKNGTLGSSPSEISEHQKQWIESLSRIDNVESQICFGCQEAINLIELLENK